MKIKTSELIGPALDWAVAKCVDPGKDKLAYKLVKRGHFNPSTNWSQGGPIIESEKLAVWGEWKSQRSDTSHLMYGPTPLVAAMRCYVASRLGDEVEVPEELK